MLRVIGNREVAKEAARVNVSALFAGQSRIVSPERSWSDALVRDAITRGGGDLSETRRAISRLVERGTPAVERPTRQHVRDLVRER